MILPSATVDEASRVYAASFISAIPCYAPGPDGACTCARAGECHSAGKHPALMGPWAAYQARLPEPSEIATWYGTEERNIAVICGQVSGGLVVIDCDDTDTYRALCYLYPALRESLTVRTGKGYHVYLRADQAVRTATFTANGHTHHVKAEGSYVIAPPSVHASGHRYAYVDPDAPIVTADLAMLSASLRRLGQPARRPDTPNSVGWAADLLRNGAKIGERDDSTFRLASYLRHFLPDDSALAILELWAESRVESRPGDAWTEQDIISKFRSAQRYDA